MGCGQTKQASRESYRQKQPQKAQVLEKPKSAPVDDVKQRKQKAAEKQREKSEKIKQERYNKMSIFAKQSGVTRLQLGTLQKQDQGKLEKVIMRTANASSEMRKKYQSTDVCLGKGSFGHVFLFKSLDGLQKFAVKIMVKELIPEKELKVVKEEIVILSKMEHPNIINYFESYEDARYLYIVMEYAEEAHELKSLIAQQHEKLVAGQLLMPEREVASLMHMLVSGVLHIHASNIVHRDLKPENCLIDKENRLKIIDFGLAKTEESDLIGNAMVGTPYYMAPEVFEEHGDQSCYKPPVDIYALGIMMYELISGHFPFNEGDDLEQVKLSSTGVEFDAPCWNHISGYAVDMIKKMTERLPENRISAQALITHEWFEIMGANKKNAPIAVDQKIIENLKGFKSVSRLHRACLNLIVKSIDGEQLDYLRSQFEAMDKEKTGLISSSDLWGVIQNLHLEGQISKEQVSTIIKEVGAYGSGKIHYSEFIAATMDAKNLLTDQRVHELFYRLQDSEDTGFVTVESIKKAMQRTGCLNEGIEDQDIHAMIQDKDVKHINKLNYDQFKTIFIQKETERVMTVRGLAKGTMTVRDQIRGITPSKGIKTTSQPKFKKNFDDDDHDTNL